MSLVFPVQLARGETLTRDCVRAEILAGDAHMPSGLVQFQLEGEDESSVRAVRLQTVVQIDEPLVTVNLSVGCPVRLTRQFTAFIDPPGSAAAVQPEMAVARAPGAELREYSPALQAALSTSNAKPANLLAPQELAAVWAPPAAASTPATAAPSPRSKRSATPLMASTSPEGAAPEPVSTGKPKRGGRGTRVARAEAPSKLSVAAATKPSGGGKLSLEAPELLEDSSSLQAAFAASAASAASAAAEASERLVKLEQSFAKLQEEQRQTQERLAGMRSKLEQAQHEQYSNPFSLGLLALSLALGGLGIYLGLTLRRERRQHEAAWWSDSKLAAAAAAAAAAPQPVDAAAPQVAGLPPLPSAQREAVDSTMPGALSAPPDERTMALPGLLEPGARARALAAEHEPLSVQLVNQGLPTQPAALHAPAVTHVLPLDAERTVTVEELIDLEQQVDFFLVLGQEDAAIELLSERLAQGADGNGLPYLKLLEIHQRRGDRAAFAEVAERFADRFGAQAPAWSENLNEGEGLEAYPEVLHGLQSNWQDAGASMAMVQALLARDQLGEAGLDLPAYRDLLMLYAVARDISEHEVRGDDIDVFLPLDARPDAAAAAAAAGMMATMVWQTTPHAVAAPIDVDISLDDPEPR